MSCFLALDCSTLKGSFALAELDKKQVKCLVFKKWLSKPKEKNLYNSHSDKLPSEIHQALRSTRRELSDLQFLAVSIGPGRWTGVRTAVNVARALSFALNISIYPINSLRLVAEQALSSISPVFVAINGFKNQVYFAEFCSQNEKEGDISLLTFPDFCKKMEAISLLQKKPVTCLSDLEDFYLLPPHLKKVCSFIKPDPSAWDLVQILFRQRTQRTPKQWEEVQAFYLRTP